MSDPVAPTRVLFICSQNRLRSPTAEHIFSGRDGLEVASAGMESSAAKPISHEALGCADLIFVMEDWHRNALYARFRPWLGNKRVICLEIPDQFEYMDPKLVRLLRMKVEPHLRRATEKPP